MHCSKPLRVVVVLALGVVAGQMFAATADFTGDGKPDIFLRNYSTGANAIWAMNGTAFSGIVDLPGLPNTSIVINASGDFNHDGKPDLVMRNKANGANAIWLMEGTALLQIVDLPGLPLAGPWQLKGVGDFDRDGNVDILWNNFGGTGGSGPVGPGCG